MAGASRTTLLAIAALSVSAAAAAADDDARALLGRMERALASRNYQGIFVHEHGGHAETLRIIHRAEAAGFVERIVSLDGSGREVIRRAGESRAYFPDQHTVLVESGQRGGSLFPGLTSLGSATEQIYTVRQESPTRISGREARVVVVEPRDELRYGYRVWIDERSAMPLKTQMRTAGGRVVEQLVFTELTLPAKIDDAALQPAVATRQYRWMHRATVNGDVAGRPADATWDAAELPPGFRLIGSSTQTVGNGQRTVTHLVFSDGLAAVSVFVETQPRPLPAAQPGAPTPAPATATAAATAIATATTMTQLGSSSALSTEVDGHRVTAIGEVPPETVRAITRSLRVGFASGATAVAGARP